MNKEYVGRQNKQKAELNKTIDVINHNESISNNKIETYLESPNVDVFKRKKMSTIIPKKIVNEYVDQDFSKEQPLDTLYNTNGGSLYRKLRERNSIQGERNGHSFTNEYKSLNTSQINLNKSLL